MGLKKKGPSAKEAKKRAQRYIRSAESLGNYRWETYRQKATSLRRDKNVWYRDVTITFRNIHSGEMFIKSVRVYENKIRFI